MGSSKSEKRRRHKQNQKASKNANSTNNNVNDVVPANDALAVASSSTLQNTVPNPQANPRTVVIKTKFEANLPPNSVIVNANDLRQFEGDYAQVCQQFAQYKMKYADELEHNIPRMRQEIVDKEKEIADLKKELESTRAENAALKERIVKLEADVAELNDIIRSQDARLKAQDDRLKIQDAKLKAQDDKLMAAIEENAKLKLRNQLCDMIWKFEDSFVVPALHGQKLVPEHVMDSKSLNQFIHIKKKNQHDPCTAIKDAITRIYAQNGIPPDQKKALYSFKANRNIQTHADLSIDELSDLPKQIQSLDDEKCRMGFKQLLDVLSAGPESENDENDCAD